MAGTRGLAPSTLYGLTTTPRGGQDKGQDKGFGRLANFKHLLSYSSTTLHLILDVRTIPIALIPSL